MSDQAHTEQSHKRAHDQVPEHAQQTADNPRWSVPKRLAFRFFFVYLGLYCLATQMLVGLRLPTFSKRTIPILGTLWPLRQITFWTAAHIFRIDHPLIYMGGAGDKTFDWTQAFCLLVLAAIATIVWSLISVRITSSSLDKRENHVCLDKWFRLFLRLVLASEMFLYGLAKIIPNQMPFPFLTRWVELFGNFTPMGVLWNSVGAAPGYEIFLGCVETLGGILLLIPRTTLLGAVICLADLVQIFAINLSYDVPQKLLSLDLILIALFLLAPELPRLAGFFLNREVGASRQPELFRSARGNRIMAALQLVACVYLLASYGYGNLAGWRSYGDGRQKSPFYGIWNVDEFSIDGKLRPPLLTDQDRWRRAIFDFRDSVTFQSMDDSFAGYGALIRAQGKTIALTKENDKNWKANFTYDQTAPGELILDGTMDAHSIHMKLERIETNKFPLANRKFHWIADYPFDRQEVRR